MDGILFMLSVILGSNVFAYLRRLILCVDNMNIRAVKVLKELADVQDSLIRSPLPTPTPSDHLSQIMDETWKTPFKVGELVSW